METKTKLLLIGGATVLVLGVSVGCSVQNKRRDRRAAAFYSELERSIAPESAGLAQSSAFDMYYWQNLSKKLKKSYFLLKAAAAKESADTIVKSWGTFDDDEDKIYGVFRSLKDHVAVSQVAHAYYQNKKINLIDDLRSRLSPEEVGEVMKIVDKLPPHRLA